MQWIALNFHHTNTDHFTKGGGAEVEQKWRRLVVEDAISVS